MYLKTHTNQNISDCNFSRLVVKTKAEGLVKHCIDRECSQSLADPSHDPNFCGKPVTILSILLHDESKTPKQNPLLMLVLSPPITFPIIPADILIWGKYYFRRHLGTKHLGQKDFHNFISIYYNVWKWAKWLLEGRRSLHQLLHC